MRYRLRTLILATALAPPATAAIWWLWLEYGWVLAHPFFLTFALPALLFLMMPELGRLIGWIFKD
jgi:hypothetical protein